MVREIGIEQIIVKDGGVIANTKIKTDQGIVGLSVAFELRREPGLIEAVQILEDAINAALVKSLDLVVPQEEKKEAVS